MKYLIILIFAASCTKTSCYTCEHRVFSDGELRTSSVNTQCGTEEQIQQYQASKSRNYDLGNGKRMVEYSTCKPQ